MLGQDDLSGGERIKDDVFHLERQFLDAANGVLNPRAHAVNDVEIGLQLLPEHADGIEHAVLPVDVIMLDDRVQKCVLRRNAHFARVDLHVLDILLVDFVVIFRQNDAAAIVEALNVRAGHADINTADHDVAFRLGVDDRFLHAFHRRLEIDDLAFAHTARRRLPDAQEFRSFRPDALRRQRRKFSTSQFRDRPSNHYWPFPIRSFFSELLFLPMKKVAARSGFFPLPPALIFLFPTPEPADAPESLS